MDLRSAYRPYQSIEVMPSLGFFAPCRAREDPAFRFEPWTLALRLSRSGKDENLFYTHFRLGVRKVGAGVDGAALWELKKECGSAYSNEALIQTGPYVLRLEATCSQMHTLFAYDSRPVPPK